MLVNVARSCFRLSVWNRILQVLAVLVIVMVTIGVTATPVGSRPLTAIGPDQAAGSIDDVVGIPPAGPTNVSGPTNSANAMFVVASYNELLGRPADTAGLDFHLARLAAGGARSRGAFAYGMLFSAEGSRHEVRRAYTDLLDRSPDAGGEDYWTNHLQGRGVLDLRVLLLAGDEYYAAAGGTDGAWIDALYLDTVGRAADAGGRQYWLDQRANGVSRTLVAAGLYLSDEALGHRVDSYYGEALGRTPGAAERAGATATIRRIGERGLRAQIWASDEVFERYLDVVLP